MELEEGILAFLKTKTGLTALVSTRIFPDTLPIGTAMPAVVYEFVSEETTDTFIQPVTELTGDSIQFSVYAETRKAADAAAREIKEAFKNHTGLMGGASGVMVQAVEQVNKFKVYESAVNRYRTTYEFRFWYEEV